MSLFISTFHCQHSKLTYNKNPNKKLKSSFLHSRFILLQWLTQRCELDLQKVYIPHSLHKIRDIKLLCSYIHLWISALTLQKHKPSVKWFFWFLFNLNCFTNITAFILQKWGTIVSASLKRQLLLYNNQFLKGEEKFLSF